MEKDLLTNLDPDHVKDSLNTLLSDIEGAGSFATSHICTEAPLPGLFMKGIGLITLPLVERHTASFYCSYDRAGDWPGEQIP